MCTDSFLRGGVQVHPPNAPTGLVLPYSSHWGPRAWPDVWVGGSIEIKTGLGTRKEPMLPGALKGKQQPLGTYQNIPVPFHPPPNLSSPKENPSLLEAWPLQGGSENLLPAASPPRSAHTSEHLVPNELAGVPAQGGGVGGALPYLTGSIVHNRLGWFMECSQGPPAPPSWPPPGRKENYFSYCKL